MLLCLGFSSNIWAVRNASLTLYSSILKRAIGPFVNEPVKTQNSVHVGHAGIGKITLWCQEILRFLELLFGF